MNGVSDTLFSGNQIHDNNSGGAFDPAVEAGGGKTMASHRVTFSNNEVHHNAGPGIWFDSSAADVVVTNNRVHDNDRAGIFFEISDGAQISGNSVWNNGWGFVAWGYGAGITISSSDRAIVSNNTVAWNARGISVISQNREYAPHNGTIVHDNVIVGTSGSFITGFYDDHGGTLFDSSNGNSGYGNRYWVGAAEPSADRFVWAGPRNTLAEYNATPGEQASTYLTVAERDTVLALASVPGLDGSPPSTTPTPTPTATPLPNPTPDPTMPAPTPTASPTSTPPSTTPLRAAVPGLAFRSGQMGADASLPGRVSWAATAGATAYQLQIQRDGASRYRARVRVRSSTGAWSPWAYGASVVAYRYQETHAAVSCSGSWTRTGSVGASGRFVRFRSGAASTARLDFRGRAVTWVAPRGLSRGSAAIYVDGAYRSTISLYRSTSVARSIAFVAAWPTVGAHTLVVKVLGTAGHPRIDVDAFAVLR